MPQVTLKTSHVNCTKSHPNYTFTAVLPSSSSELDELISSNDKHKISNIQVDLIKRRMDASFLHRYDFQLKCMVGSESQLLTKLWNKFKNEIKISVSIREIHYMANFSKGGQVLVSAENMSIDSHNFSCRSTMVLPNLNVAFIEQGNSWEMKIALDIPEPKKPFPENEEKGKGHPILRKMLDESFCTDLVITAKNGAEVKAHRVILAVHSPVFLTNFRSGMKESQTGELDMPDFSEEAVRALLDFLYKDDLTKAKENLEIAFELLRAAHKYEIPNLEAAMKERLMEAKDENIGTKMAYGIYEFLGQTENEADSELKTKIVRVLKMNLNEFVELPEMQEFFPKTMRKGISAVKIFLDFAQADPPIIPEGDVMHLGNGSGDQNRAQASS